MVHSDLKVLMVLRALFHHEVQLVLKVPWIRLAQKVRVALSDQMILAFHSRLLIPAVH